MYPALSVRAHPQRAKKPQPHAFFLPSVQISRLDFKNVRSTGDLHAGRKMADQNARWSESGEGGCTNVSDDQDELWAQIDRMDLAR